MPLNPAGDDPDWRTRWVGASEHSLWRRSGGTLSCTASPGAPPTTDWMEYRHWIRFGGTHHSSVPLPHWPDRLSRPNPRYSNLSHNAGVLSCTGALSDLERRQWLSRSDDPQFRAAIERLFESSHVAPIMDHYGYNVAGTMNENPVRDLMVSITLEEILGDGRFEIDLTNGHRSFRLVLDAGSQSLVLLADGDPVPIRQAGLAPESLKESVQIDFSLFDSQALVVVNGEPLFPAFGFDADDEFQPLRRPLKIGAAGLSCVVSELRLYRDVFYTPGRSDDDQTYVLGTDEFFVLGDNSPVSVDSRVWDNPAVPRTALIGKPFVVHLPSRQAQFAWGGRKRHVRLPDFSRVRAIH